MIQTNVFEIAWRIGVRRLLFLSSSCFYPKLAEQPIKESAILSGLLESTNEPYAIAKIAGIKLCESEEMQCKIGFRFEEKIAVGTHTKKILNHFKTSQVLPQKLPKASPPAMAFQLDEV